MSLQRRGAAWALTLAGLAGLGILLLLAPPIRDYENFYCHGPDAAAPYFAEHPAGWIAVRAPQMFAPFLSYDEASGTTVVTAGCGHEAGDAFRVRGDLRAQPAPTRLLLRQVEADAGPSHNATSASTTAGGPYDPTGSPPTPPVGGLYATVSLLPRMLATWLALAGLASGLVLLLLPTVPVRSSWVPAAGLLAGMLAAWWVQESGGGNSFLAFLLLVPLACLALPGFGVAAFALRRNPEHMAVLLAFSLLALGFLAQLFSFLEAFPSAPTA